MNRTWPDIDAVTNLVDEIAQTAILPRFRRLASEDVERKSTAADPDDIVTVVDRDVEDRLTLALRALTPSAPVIGEEAVHSRPELLNLCASDGPLWLLDPIDGTKNFARGDDGFGVMLAWVVGGRAQVAWILLPARRQVFVAEAGSGAFLNGVRATVPVPSTGGQPRGGLLVRYMPGSLGETVTQAMRGHFTEVKPAGCAAVEYTDILAGNTDFAVYYRLLPWDHAAPALILVEGGGSVEHLDGTPYSARSDNQVTVVARDARVSGHVRNCLTPDV
jgi:fructose-1,6-bisphosphatase/inositol monophosphatase family enzyme